MALVYLVVVVGGLLMLIGVLLSVAFMILLERSVLSYIQVRSGPNKVGYLGVIQSFGDAIKLFIKEQSWPSYSNVSYYYFAPILSLFVMMMVWFSLPLGSGVVSFNISLMYIFVCLSLGVYVLLLSGWASNSNYAMLGAVRGVAQTISYEVSLMLLLLGLVVVLLSLNLEVYVSSQELIWFFVMYMPLVLAWLVTIMAETNRSPFDFAEGESELVSGFNIEYGSGGFALLFLAEYGMIIYMSYFVVYLYWGGLGFTLVLGLSGLFFCFVYLWVRGSLPRLRYDKLMMLVWSGLLCVALGMLVFYSMVGLYM